MTTNRLIEALKRSDWRSAFESGDDRLASAASDLRTHAETARADHGALADALGLLSDVCLIMLSPDDWDAPYKPWASYQGGRTLVPDDLSPEELEVLNWIVENDGDLELRARSADICWLRSGPRRQYQLARTAVKLWTSRVIDEKTWFTQGSTTWTRALNLASRLGMPDQVEIISVKIGDAARAAQSPVFLLRLIELARSLSIGFSPDEAQSLLESAAERDVDPPVHRELLHEAARWSDDPDYRVLKLESIAQSWISEGEQRRSSSSLITADFFSNALQQLRSIPGAQRSKEVKELMEDLPRMIRIASLEGLSDMKKITSDPIDLSSWARDTTRRVTCDDPVEALRQLAGATGSVSMEEDREEAEQLLQGSLLGLIGRSSYRGDGRKVYGSSGSPQEHYGIPEAVWDRMIDNYENRIKMVTIGALLPGWRKISSQHNLNENDFLRMVIGGSVVPPSVTRLFAHGLFLGFNGDFVSALFILTPQVEALARFHLSLAGVNTSRIDATGVENEVALGTLMAEDAAAEVFGTDLAYELRLLFCEPQGPNLRNHVAHGLISDSEAFGELGLYCWWFALRLVLLQYLARAAAEANSDSQASSGDDEAEMRSSGADEAERSTSESVDTETVVEETSPGNPTGD